MRPARGLQSGLGMTPMLSSLIWLIAFAVGFVWMARRYRRRARRTELQFERDVLRRRRDPYDPQQLNE
jgi:ferredoxin-NADP reductase